MLLGPVRVAMLERAVLHGDDLVMMLLWKRLRVRDRLLRGVIVILVDFPVYRSVRLVMLRLLDRLVGDGWVDLLVNSRIVLANSRQDLIDGFLDFVHVD